MGGAFHGAAVVTLDAKGRLAVPTRHREALLGGSKHVVLTAHPEGCVLIYPPAAWEPVRARAETFPSFHPQASWWKRLLLGFEEHVVPDGSGRLLVSGALRQHAQLQRDAMLVGQGGLKLLLSENNFNVDSTGYDQAINLAKEALANGDIPDAQAKLAIANDLLEELFAQMNNLASDPENNDDRIEAFTEKTITEIKSLLENGNKIGLTQNTINELQATLAILESGDAELILAATSEDANLAKELKEVNKVEETQQKTENKAEEKAVRDENKADEKELRESNPEAAQQLKVDNKEVEKEQKAENKAEEKVLREENKEAEKALRDYLKLISIDSYFSYDDDWEEEPTESDYNDATDTPTDKDLKKQLKAEAKAQKDAEKAYKKEQKQDDKDRKDKEKSNNGNGGSKSCPAGKHYDSGSGKCVKD